MIFIVETLFSRELFVRILLLLLLLLLLFSLDNALLRFYSFISDNVAYKLRLLLVFSAG